MINNVVLTGRITKDPELKYTQQNKPNVYFSLAVNRINAGQNGEKQADFISCVVYGKQAENLTRYIKKGGLIGVEGTINTSQYKNKKGDMVYVQNVYVNKITYLESGNQQNKQQNNKGNRQNNTGHYNQNQYNNYDNFGYSYDNFDFDMGHNPFEE